MTFDLNVRKHADGSVELVGDAPDRIRVAEDLLDDLDQAVVELRPDGGLMFTLTNAVLWYRRVGPCEDARTVEFERVA